MRQIALDTETTGIGHETGHRIIEIGCVEFIDRHQTGRVFHRYLNPQRKVDEGAFRVHGLSTEFLQDKALFQDIAAEFIEFIQGAELIIHNAVFDLGFLNAELRRMGHSGQIESYCSVLDTLVLARQKHPGQRNSLDALCKRYDVDNTHRQLHGALLDAHILVKLYLAMTGGQGDLFADNPLQESLIPNQSSSVQLLSSSSPIHYASAEELNRHQAFVDKFL